VTVSVIDLVVLVLAIGFAISGYRQGFVTAALSFVGFVGGAALGIQLASPIAKHLVSGSAQVVVAVAVVLGIALLGQVGAVYVGSELRSRITWQSARTVDSVLGTIVSVLTVLLVSWMVATPLASSPYPQLSSAVRKSAVVREVNSVVPSPVREVYQSLRGVIDRGDFPDVFGPLSPTRVLPVKPPDPKLARDPVVRRVRASVVKVVGVAPSCSRRIEGSGFVYSPGRVITNAHVVAGVQDPMVQVDGTERRADVVLYDPNRDVAVLSVAGMQAPALHFSAVAASRGDSAIILGYPEDGPFFVGPARVRDRENIRGPNIYDDNTVTRSAYTVRGDVRSGNSGGPLLRPDGTVYGMIFAAALDQKETGFALTADEIEGDASSGRTASTPVSTQSCDKA
jgi:S1-C subfamily serine protease